MIGKLKIVNLKFFYKKYDYILLTLLLGLIVFFIFVPVVNYSFINFDDNILVYENEEIKNLDINTVASFFSKPYHSLYHPLVYVSFAVDYNITGSMNAKTFHSTNLLLHIFNSLLILLLIYLLSDNIKFAFLAGLLFVAHPMHVEAVVWISERKEVLCAFFYFLSLLFYVLFKKYDGRKIFYVLAVVIFLCALFSKVMAVTLPAVLVLYDHVFKDKINVKDKIIFFALSAIFIIIGMLAAVPSVDGNFFIDLLKNLYRAAFQYSFYVVKFFLPLKLSIVYPPAMENNIVYMILVPALLIFWSLINIAAFKRSKKVFFGLAFFTITIFPVLNLIPFGLEIPADRFTYIPYAGLFYAVIIFVSQIKMPQKRSLVFAALCIFIGICCFLSNRRVGEWKDNVSLFSRSIERYPTYVAYTNRGAAYLDASKFDDAAADELRALETGSSYEAIAHMLLAAIYKETGKYEEALKEINIALESASDDDAEGAYFARAEIYQFLERPDDAVKDLRYLYDYYENTNYIFWSVANIYEKDEKYHLVILEMDKLLELEPDNEEAKQYRKNMFLKITNYPGGYPIEEIMPDDDGKNLNTKAEI